MVLQIFHHQGHGAYYIFTRPREDLERGDKHIGDEVWLQGDLIHMLMSNTRQVPALEPQAIPIK